MEDGSDLLLPVIVFEMPSILLMAAIRDVQVARPTLHQVVMEVIEKMGYRVQLIRIIKRVHEAYFAQLYLVKVPIQVNIQPAYIDGVRVLEPTKIVQASMTNGLLFIELDRPDDQPCMESMEFNLIRNVLISAVGERYRDAGIAAGIPCAAAR